MALSARNHRVRRMSAPVSKALGAQGWSARLAEVRRDPDRLLAFAKELRDHQAEQAWKDWRKYTLYRHHESGKVIGLLKQSKELREVSRPYNRPYWHCPSEFGRQVIGPCNQALWQLSQRPEWRAVAEAAYVTPKHGHIMRLLVDIERGRRDPKTAQEIKR